MAPAVRFYFGIVELYMPSKHVFEFVDQHQQQQQQQQQQLCQNEVWSHFLVLNRVFKPETIYLFFQDLEDFGWNGLIDGTSFLENNIAEEYNGDCSLFFLLRHLHSENHQKINNNINNNNSCDNHPLIRNYNHISSVMLLTPQIFAMVELPTQERVAILKTFWIRIIQRKWRAVLSKQPMQNVSTPRVKGMLSSLQQQHSVFVENLENEIHRNE